MTDAQFAARLPLGVTGPFRLVDAAGKSTFVKFHWKPLLGTHSLDWDDLDAVTLYAHNLPLEAWAEMGPLGLALVLGLYASAGTLLWRIRRHPDAWLVAPGVAAFLLANLVDWPWHLAGATAIWAICLGGCLALGRQASD